MSARLRLRLGAYPPAGRVVHQALFAKALPRLAVRRVRAADVDGAGALARAIDGIRGTGIPAAEAEWIDRIESWRRRFAAREGPISVELSSGERRQLSPRRLAAVSSIHRPWGVFLMRLTSELRPRSCVELGAAIGISTAYQGAALVLNGHGHLRTVEGAAELAGLARETLDELGIDRAQVIEGRFDDVLEDVLAEAAPVDLAYLDAGKGREHNLRQFERLLPSLAPGAVLVMDDVHWSREMRSAWREIRSHERVALSVDLWRLGACLIS
jgi:predicted O-methyltransferase YrrM